MYHQQRKENQFLWNIGDESTFIVIIKTGILTIKIENEHI